MSDVRVLIADAMDPRAAAIFRERGIEVDEKLAANFPFGRETGERGRLNGGWGEVRKRDGTVIKQ